MIRRILLTTDVLGGVWDFCTTLAQQLDAAGVSVVLLALGTPTESQHTTAAQAGAELMSAPLKLEWMTDAANDVLRTRELVARVARDVHADVIHANQFAAACSATELPVVLTLHSDVLSWRRWTLGSSEVPAQWEDYANLVREAVSRADSVVSVSSFLAREVGDLYQVRRPIEVIHNGWPAALRVAQTRERSTVAAGRVWDAAKNILLIATAAEGWSRGPIYLAGENAHPEGGVATIPNTFTPVGFLPRADMDALLARAKVYVSAAKYDPFGLLPLQAALHGCALLLSDIPSYREVWGDAATYFRADDADDLRAKWRAVLDAPADLRALRHAQSQLTPRRMVDGYMAVYARLRQAVAA